MRRIDSDVGSHQVRDTTNQPVTPRSSKRCQAEAWSFLLATEWRMPCASRRFTTSRTACVVQLALTKPLDVSVGDQADSEAEEGLMDVGASFPADPQAAEAVRPGDRVLDAPAESVQAGAVRLSPFGDHRTDPPLPQERAVLVVVVAAVREELVGAPSRPADGSRHRRNLVQQGQELGDVVAVSAGQRHRERDPLAVGDDVVLAARACAVDRAGSALGPLRGALTWEESITARVQSSWFFDQAAGRRRHVMPDPNPSSWGRYSHWIPVCRTKRIPHIACRSGTRGRPSTCSAADRAATAR